MVILTHFDEFRRLILQAKSFRAVYGGTRPVNPRWKSQVSECVIEDDYVSSPRLLKISAKRFHKRAKWIFKKTCFWPVNSRRNIFRRRTEQMWIYVNVAHRHPKTHVKYQNYKHNCWTVARILRRKCFFCWGKAGLSNCRFSRERWDSGSWNFHRCEWSFRSINGQNSIGNRDIDWTRFVRIGCL